MQLSSAIENPIEDGRPDLQIEKRRVGEMEKNLTFRTPPGCPDTCPNNPLNLNVQHR